MTSVLHLVLLQRLNEKCWSQLNIKEKEKNLRPVYCDHNKNIYSLCICIDLKTHSKRMKGFAA
jgi:hypothetical protein